MSKDVPSDEFQELFGEPIHTHSRAEAIRDGVFVDVSVVAREIGFDAAFAVTKALHDIVSEIPHGLPFLLWIAYAEVVANAHVQLLDFDVRLVNEEKDSLRIAVDCDGWTLGFIDDF